MKIAVIASNWISVPPKEFGFGAQEYLAYLIVEGMIKKGHDVTLFATGDSKTTGKLISVTPVQIMDVPFPDPKIIDAYNLLNLSEAYSLANQFDIIHNHSLPYGILFSHLTTTPTVHTLHHNIYRTRADIFLYEKYKNANYISISLAQRAIIPELRYIANVYNGVDEQYYAFKEKPDDMYLLYIGRIKKYKGLHIAIEAAKRLNKKLIIAAPLPKQTQSDYAEVSEYFENEIKPNITGNIQFLDGVKGAEKLRLLQNAKVFLFPDTREEPCPVTPLEAMACGLPVVGYARGSIIEEVKDTITGYVINQSEALRKGDWYVKQTGIDGLCEAIQKIYHMSEQEYSTMRKVCRTHIERNFTAELMINNYEKVYTKLLQNLKQPVTG